MEQTLNSVPDWAAKIVWYQIFPDRFYNGDMGNEPDTASLVGAWPHDPYLTWQLSPWTADWYKLQPWEQAYGKDIWFNLQRRRYGGDLQGIIDKLDYLKDLGIGGIYLNPVFQAPSLHKYDGACFHHIDVHFGPDPKSDLALMSKEIPDNPATWVWTEADKLALKLIREAHKRNIRIIFDGVFNHMGINSFAFQDIIKNRETSRFKEWFTITDWKTSNHIGIPFRYEGWFGVNELPELREDENGIVQGPRDYIFSSTSRWMDPDGDGNPSDGIDGWRLDVAYCIKHPFWKAWRRHVKTINPEAYLTAEIIDTPQKVLPYIEGDEFDAVMNYNFAFAAHDFFINDRLKTSPTEFVTALRGFLDLYPLESLYVVQNLFDSHDTQRILSAIANPDLGHFAEWGDFFNNSKGSNPAYHTRAPKFEDIAKLKQMIAFQMCFVGAPMIYYGTEAGMWGGNDPDCRKPMLWPDLHFESEIFFPNQHHHPADSVAFNEDLHDFIRSMIHFRNEHDVLQTGDFDFMTADDDKDIFAFRRDNGSECIVIVINRSDQTQEYAIDPLHLLGKRIIRDAVSGREYEREKSNFNVELSPRSLHILY